MMNWTSDEMNDTNWLGTEPIVNELREQNELNERKEMNDEMNWMNEMKWKNERTKRDEWTEWMNELKNWFGTYNNWNELSLGLIWA